MNNKQMYNLGIIPELGIEGKENWMEGEDDDMRKMWRVQKKLVAEEQKKARNRKIAKYIRCDKDKGKVEYKITKQEENT